MAIRNDISAPLIAGWPLLLDAASRYESPEAWWLMQDRCCVLIEADGTEARASATESDLLCRWLQRLPCPSVALAPDSAVDPLFSACDTRTSSSQEAASIARNIARSPHAALTLVQVLRIAADLPVESALEVESLGYATLQGGPEFQRWRDFYQRPTQVLHDEDPAVQIEHDAGRLSIRLNRPQAHNALNVAMRDALVEAFDLVSADSTLSAVVSGIGRCYSVGGDLNEFGERPDPSTAHRIRSLRNPARALFRCAQRVEFRVHNACIGSGIELPAFGRRISARSDTYFQLPELRLGLIPGSGGCVSLPRRIGRQRTALLALGGKRLSARRALEWGLIDEVVG